MPLDDFIGTDTNYLNAILAELTGYMGEAVFGLLIASMVFLVLYYASDGRFGVPAVVMTLAGSWLVGEIPVQYRGTVNVIVIVGLTAGLFALMRRYFLRPSA